MAIHATSPSLRLSQCEDEKQLLTEYPLVMYL